MSHVEKLLAPFICCELFALVKTFYPRGYTGTAPAGSMPKRLVQLYNIKSDCVFDAIQSGCLTNWEVAGCRCFSLYDVD